MAVISASGWRNSGAVKGAGLQQVKLLSGNWFAPPGSGRSCFMAGGTILQRRATPRRWAARNDKLRGLNDVPKMLGEK